MADAREPLYAAVVVDIDAPLLAQPFTYRIPDGLEAELAVGDAVVAPFGRTTEQIGYIVGISTMRPDGISLSRIKDISARIAGASAFDQSLWETAQWVAEQTLCDLRDVVKLIAPNPSAAHIRTTFELAAGWRDRIVGVRSAGSLQLVERLSNAPQMRLEYGPLTRGIDAAEAAIGALKRNGIILSTREVVPPEVKTKTVRLLRLCVDADVALAEAERLEGRAARQARLLRDLVDAGKTASALPAAGGILNAEAGPAAKALEAKSLVRYHEVSVRRDPCCLDQAGPPRLR